jgi:hypothetical protein
MLGLTCTSVALQSDPLTQTGLGIEEFNPFFISHNSEQRLERLSAWSHFAEISE